jgi:nicotinate dehydrogenase subunit B
LPDDDIRAMAAYLADGASEKAAAEQKQAALAMSQAAEADAKIRHPEGERIFEGACTACHADGTPLASLALNSTLHSDRPDNVLQTLMNGAIAPARLANRASRDQLEIMSMPAFRDSLSDRQIADLAAYLRARFAPDKAQWSGLPEAAPQVRGAWH